MDILQRLQLDIATRLEDHADFQFVPVHVMRPRSAEEAVQIEEAINAALAGTADRNGKSGLAALVLLPECSVPDPNIPGPQITISAVVRLIENPMINEGAGGTGITAEQQSLKIMMLLHQWAPNGYAALFAARDAMRAIEVETGGIGYDVKFEMKVGVLPVSTCARPVATVGATVTLTCATASSTIRYTLDGTLPTRTRGQVYSAPIALPASGVLLRAVGIKHGLADSDVCEQEF